jgi:hypothetical protein
MERAQTRVYMGLAIMFFVVLLLPTTAMMGDDCTHHDADLLLAPGPRGGAPSPTLPYARRQLLLLLVRPSPQLSVPAWNETTFRSLAFAQKAQLLSSGYDTIVIDGGWSADLIDKHGLCRIQHSGPPPLPAARASRRWWRGRTATG